MAVIQKGQYKTRPDIFLYLLEPSCDAKFIWSLEKEGVSARTAPLSNPRGLLLEVYAPEGKTLAQAVRQRLVESARRKGLVPLLDGKIPYRYGPDGRTLIVMAPVTKTAQAPYSNTVEMTVQMEFKNPKDAARAKDYIDLATYKVVQNGKALEATLTAQGGTFLEVMEAFSRLAKQMNGEMKGLSAPSEL